MKTRRLGSEIVEPRISCRMDPVRIAFDCNGHLNWAKPDPSGNGTIFKDSASLGHNLFERAFEHHGARFEMELDISKPDPNVTNSSIIQTLYDGKADIAFERFPLKEDKSELVDLMFPVWVSIPWST